MYFLSVEGVNDSLRSALLPEQLLNSSSSLAACHEDTPPTAAANSSLTSSPLTSTEVTLLGLLFGLFWVVSVLGNSLVCLVIHRSRRTQSTTNYFVVSLACSDLLLSLACAPLVLLQVCVGHWPLTAAACKVLRFLQHLCPGAQLYVLLSICVDRFYTIVYPLSFKVSREKAKRMILASWLLDALFVSPCLFFYGSSQNRCDFFLPGGWDGLSYSLAHLLLGFLLPALLILSFYHRVVRYIWRIGADGRTVRRTMNVVPRTKVKTIKMFLILNCMFLLSWMPFYVAQLWHPAETTVSGRDRPDLLLFITVVWVSFSSTASKPTIYSVYNANFRRGMRETFCMSSMKCYRSNAYTITASSRVAKKNYVGILDLSVPPKTLVKDSVYDTFDREAKEKKLAWPISTNPPNTFV